MAVISFAIHRTSGDRKGEIVRHGWTELAVASLQIQEDEKPDLAMVSGEVLDPNLEYVTDMGIEPRPKMSAMIDKVQIAADDNDTATISDLPAGTVLFINGGEYPVTGDKIALTLDRPATVEIVAKCWPYVDVTFVLDAD